MSLTDSRRAAACAFVLCCFSLLVYFQHEKVYGDDLTSSFVSCRLLASSQADHLYDRNGGKFDVVRTPAWLNAAESGGVQRLQELHPFVQLPLWPWVLRPLCTRLQFPAFYHLFLALSAISTSAILWIVVRYWTTGLLHPVAVALTCGAVFVSGPYKYYLFLGQTHLLFVFLSVAAISLDRKNKFGAAGICLGVASAIKLTPALLVVYWMSARRWRSVLWAVACIASIHAIAYLILGKGVMDSYIHDVSALSHTLLLAVVNQSVPAWLSGLSRPPGALFDWTMYPLPDVLRLSCTAASFLCALVGGHMDYVSRGRNRPPYGAIFAFVGGMMFAPIAWTHYFVILVIPALLIVDYFRTTGSSSLWLVIPVAVFALSLYPVSYGSVLALYQRFPSSRLLPLLARGQVLSGFLCLAGLLRIGLSMHPEELGGEAKTRVSSLDA